MENFLLKKNKILIISAHPDDEILGCGGTIIKLKRKSEVKTLFMTNGVSSRDKSSLKKIIQRRNQSKKLFNHLSLSKPTFFNFPDNKMDSVPLLQIIKKIEKYINFFRPDIILTHNENCLNIDHQKTFEAVITACRPVKNNFVKAILGFEISSSTDWNLKKKIFSPNFFIDISKEIDKKIEALKFYKTELRKYPHSRSVKSVKSLASYRGTSCGVSYAEAFYLYRYIEK
jgi:LmbE family N-acetylglucosaminyl deacetylase